MAEAGLYGAYQSIRMEVNETGHLSIHRERKEFQIEQVFKSHFKALHSYAFTIVKDSVMAEEMVQNVFVKIWEKREQLDIQTSITAYLYRAVYHESLNHIKHLKVRAAYETYATNQMKHQSDNAEKKILLSDLEVRIDQALSELPEQCRTIFQMSRYEELKYQEIADRLGLSIKTVENQMGKALKLMRTKLKDFLPLVLLSLLNL